MVYSDFMFLGTSCYKTTINDSFTGLRGVNGNRLKTNEESHVHNVLLLPNWLTLPLALAVKTDVIVEGCCCLVICAQTYPTS